MDPSGLWRLERFLGLPPAAMDAQQDEHFAALLCAVGAVYSLLGDTQSHRRLLLRALGILEAGFGPEHRDLAPTLSELGQMGGEDSFHWFARALWIQEREYSYGPDRLHVLRTL